MQYDGRNKQSIAHKKSRGLDKHLHRRETGELRILAPSCSVSGVGDTDGQRITANAYQASVQYPMPIFMSRRQTDNTDRGYRKAKLSEPSRKHHKNSQIHH